MAPSAVGSFPVKEADISAMKAQTTTIGEVADNGNVVNDAEPQPPVVKEVAITEGERASGIMSKQNIEKAIVALNEDGVVVLTNAVDADALDLLNGPMIEQAKKLRDMPGTQFNYGEKAHNILQHMIPDPNYLHPSIHANPFATQVCTFALGPNPVLRYHKANTNFPGDTRQPVHSDVHYEHPRACFALAVNIVPIDCDANTGSTEVWLGTHATTIFSDQDGVNGIFPHLLAERRKIVPPVQPMLPRGSIIIRDMRLWHAGMPNKTADTVRVMLNLIYFADWYRCPMQIQFPPTAQTKIEQLEKTSGTSIAARYVEGLDHMTLRHTHDFAQDDLREHWGRNIE
ncbi:Phytanoyl-CoA dioxygenase [Niveomyces insectorum RCEF 264]|uniref:Phytanoyl-CoA dioxygenase n=1 Tax=Niveomyces insectorum RCEF 264 TaxID=1081102 RepID=A0A167RTA7_9HYPO|nr:Phytanoyl-CoA dioxygenase [Niveomyces insectorum RCEF 264]